MDIEKVMAETNLTAEELGTLCGVSRSMVYKWITGTRPHPLRVPRINKIISALYLAKDQKLLPLKREKSTTAINKEARMYEIKSILIKCLKTPAANR